MFGRRVVCSILRRSKQVCEIHKLRDTRPSFSFSSSSSTEQSFKFFTPPIARHCFQAFRSHPIPKGQAHVPYIRNFSRMASAGAEHKEGLKLLVTAGTHAQKVVGIWLFGSAAWVFSMVVLGGVTRLTRSGLSMTDWKFTGNLPPLSDEEWLKEFEKYKQSPEYKRVNKGMKIEDFKFIYWMEYAHRMWGRALGVMFALPYSYFLHKGYITLRLGLRLSALFALGAGQGFIGWWMVKSGLEEPPSEYSQPRVSPYRLAAHLTSAFAIYCSLFWTALSVVMPEPPAESLTWVHGAAKVKRLALRISVLVGLTAVSGAFVTGNDAGHAFNTFPKMGDTWIPDDINCTARSPYPCNCNSDFSGCFMVVNKKAGHTSCSTICNWRRCWHGSSSGHLRSFYASFIRTCFTGQCTSGWSLNTYDVYDTA